MHPCKTGKQPNFFILGAPKCGTTSLAAWLGQHPNIFITKPKEPRYFNSDYAAPGRLQSIEKYEGLFKNVTPDHKAIGEASTGYLRSNVAVPNILSYAPSARFIVCLRNPIEMAQSVHSQLVKMGTETEIRFKHAWELQQSRRQGINIPKTSHDEKVFMYGENCLLGQQMKRLFEIADREQVLEIFLEDMKLDARGEYRRVLKFLGVADDGRKHFPVLNARTVPRIPIISQGLKFAVLAKAHMGIRASTGVGRIIGNLNNKKYKLKIVDTDMLEELRQYFKEDVHLLGEILRRNLKHWIG